MVIIDFEGAQVKISDVADVRFTFKEITSKSRLYGVESISLEVSKRTGENLIAISDEIKEVVEEFRKTHGQKITFTILNDTSVFVSTIVKDLENNIYTGMLFVFLVLFLFMGRRNAVFVGVAIPFSMLMSFLVLNLAGITLNMVVLVSLIISLGMLVDNAIVVVENIYRHVQSGKSNIEAAITGVSEVAAPVIASTMTTLLAFFPMIFMPGMMGEFMKYLPITLIITLTCSLAVGLIFNPVICSTLMKKTDRKKVMDEEELVFQSKFLVRYSRVLEWTLNHRLITFLIMAGFWIGMMTIYFALVNPEVKTEFFPKEEPREAVIRITPPQGTILSKKEKVVKQVEEQILPFREHTDSIVTNISATENKVRLAFPDWQKWTDVKPSEVVERIRELLPKFLGAEVRLDQVGGGMQVGRDVVVEIKGDDLKELKTVADKIKSKIKDVPGLVNLETSADSSRPQFKINIDREKIAHHGLRTSQVAAIIRTAFNGEDISTYRVGQDEYDVVVRLDEKFRRYDSDLGALQIQSSTGEAIPLSELATVSRELAGGTIHHIDMERVITVEGDSSAARSGAEVLKDVKSRLADYQFPRGIVLDYTGANTEQNETQDFLVNTFFVALFLIFLLLVTQFNSLALPFIIIASVVTSLAGVILGMIIHQTPISILMGGIGTISLAGIVVNNAIVLIDYIRQLREKGRSCQRAIVIAGMTRLRPVVLTAITTILGLIPITMGMDIDFYRFPNVVLLGSEGGTVWKPMNFAIIYGLAVATFLTLFIVPVLYSLNESAKNRFKKLFAWVTGRNKKITGEQAL